MTDKIISFSIEQDFSEQIKNATDEAIQTALEACGVQAVSNAVKYATAKGVVDTGLLRNSLTYAMAGHTAKNRVYHAAYGSNKNKKGKRISANSAKAGAVKVGRYEGVAPSDSIGNRVVYIGTNVFYAIYNELGTFRMKARPFLRPAIENHRSDYKTIFERVLKKLGN